MADGDSEPPADVVAAKSTPDIEVIDDNLTGEKFREWRREQQFRENLRDGNPEYNNGGYESSELRHSPHTLLQCRRKQWYRENTAPQETESPDGIFSIGSWIEESIIEPWIAGLAQENGGFVANSLWLSSTICTEVGELTLEGSSDPAIVNSDGIPRAITEVKSKQSLSNLSSPSTHHKAQLHAYLHNAREKYDLADYPQGYLIYVGRKRLDVQVFSVDFVAEFFEDVVLDWCKRMSYCRIEGMLPAADPEQSWECKLCEYRGRCGNYDGGERDLPWEDCSVDGLLPLFSYPKGSVIDYMRAHPDDQITPTVATEHPGLAEVYEVADWQCSRCNNCFKWDSVQWEGNVDDPPICPDCIDDSYRIDLSGPAPQ